MSADRLSFDAGAGAYDRCMGRWSRLDIPALLAAAQVAAGKKVLDVATGTGEAAVLAASLVGPSGRVLGVDISLPMLRVAKPKGAASRITFAAMDGQALAYRDHTFDAVVCRLGLMFFPDVARGLEEFRRVLRPHGRLAVSVLSTPERSPLLGIVFEALARQLPTEREALGVGFSLADAPMLEQVLAKAGFQRLRVTRDVREIVFESFDDYWSPFEAGGGRFGQIYQGLPEDGRRAVTQEVRQRMSQFESNGRFVLEVETLFGLASV
ncbi:MAG: class I SAM-dependent methyltransferase [Candidatus Rokubacteria bacterium]|nr:class I SAM-dependent methyltransferase [Candidatus Rokubacteria bacterium]